MQTVTVDKKPYDFPVALEPEFTATGKVIPRRKVVVNKVDDMPIVSVSNGYCLVEHKTLVDAASGLMREIGAPEEKFVVSTNGATMIGEFTYKDKTLAMQRGDLIGLRVYIENSYDATRKARVRLGGLVLACMNGAVSSTNIFSLEVRHDKNAHNIDWKAIMPKREEIFAGFQGEIQEYNRLATINLGDGYKDFVLKAHGNGIITQRAVDAVPEQIEDKSAWGLYNHFTYDITHQGDSAYIGRVNKLARVSRWFKEEFAEQ